MIVELTDGRTISVPLAWFPRQFDATPEQRTGYELIGRGQGIHWKRSTKIYRLRACCAEIIQAQERHC